MERVVFAAKVLAVSALAFIALTFASGFCGIFVYSFLDQHMAADDLSAFSLFFLPWAVFGTPSLVISSRLLLLHRSLKTIIALLTITFVLGTLGFAGFWVGAMGI